MEDLKTVKVFEQIISEQLSEEEDEEWLAEMEKGAEKARAKSIAENLVLPPLLPPELHGVPRLETVDGKEGLVFTFLSNEGEVEKWVEFISLDEIPEDGWD